METTRRGFIGLLAAAAVGAVVPFKLKKTEPALTYAELHRSYVQASQCGEPDIGYCTPKTYAYIKNKFQTQQRFDDTYVGVGFHGLKFENAVIVPSVYAPGSEPGVLWGRLEYGDLT